MAHKWWPFHTQKQQTTSAVRPAQSSHRTIPQSQHLMVFLAGLTLALGLWVSLALWLPGERGELEVGRPSPVTILAPRNTEFISDVRTAEAKSQAANRPENIVYTTDQSLPAEQRRQLVELLTTIGSIRDDPTLSTSEKRQELTGLPSASVLISDTLASSIISLDESAWENVRVQTLNLYDKALTEYDYEIDEAAIERLQERSLPFWTSSLPQVQRDLVLLFTTSFLRVNHTLDEAATEQRKQEARAAVENKVVQIQAGQSIVRDGEIVTPETIEMLEAVGALPKPRTLLDISGFAVISVLLSVMTMLYLVLLQQGKVRQPRPLFAIVGLIILTTFAGRLVIPMWPDYSFAFPMATVVLVLAVVFNSHLAFASVMLISVVLGLLAQNDLTLMLTMSTGGVVAVLSVRGAERPLTFLRAGAMIALVTALTRLGLWMVETSDATWTAIQLIIFFSAVNGVLSAIMALGLFNIVGHIAGVVTPLQLMELAHPSQPLIRKVVQEAPGTYYHSVSVGNLAEAAGEAVGADALLLRVAAYYHDIGKTIRPYFFTDNQTGRENVHNELDPQTSATIIIDHVREGVKMAQAAGLPQQIIDFISTHHGTSTVGHFYQLALREQDTVDIDDFRYPGPKPFTREQGILLLADSVEATVRAKAQSGLLKAQHAGSGSNGKAGSAQTINDLVASIIDDRVRSGQLDNTALTLRDLVVIRETFVSSLQGIYHPRVEYAPQLVKS